MKLLALLSIFIVVFGTAFKNKFLSSSKFDKKSFCICLLVSLAVRLFFAYTYRGHSTDINCFISWADMLFKDGIPSFYSSEAFTDYPPGYMYILWFLGFFLNTLRINRDIMYFFIKLPAIFADLALSCLLYNKLNGQNRTLSLLLLFNPVLILNSAVWGQVDSVFALAATFSLVMLTENKSLQAYLTFALAVLIKPQACMYAPIYLYYFFENSAKGRRYFKQHTSYAVLSAIIALALILPFGISNTFRQYMSTLASYPYASVNAFNLWSMLGLNWQELTPAVSTVSAMFIIVIAVTSFFILHTLSDKSKYLYTAVFICLSVFMLSAKMHERYAFPAIVFAAFSVCRDRKRYIMFLFLTAMQFFNIGYILFVYEQNPSLYFNSAVVISASWINLIIFLFCVYFFANDPVTHTVPSKAIKADTEERIQCLTKKDAVPMLLITLFYAFFAFSNLGTLSAPENGYIITENNGIVLEFSGTEQIKKIDFFLGSYNVDESTTLLFKIGDTEYPCRDADVFAWESLETEASGDTLVIETNKKVSIKELRLTDINGNTVIPSNVKQYDALFDEEETVPEQRTYANSTYFDEIYHVRTAYEFIHKLPVYEWTHPPLGKFIISLGIRLFGMNTFGYRFAGALFGVLMLPVIYCIAKQLFKKIRLCVLITLIFAFDFMHYTQSRIATIDVFVTMFIMLMYYFMLLYLHSDFYNKKKSFVYLLLCGISVGLAVSTKWTGIYAAAGLAILFFIHVARQYSNYRCNTLLPFNKNLLATLIFCVFCFIIIPVTIYCVSYIPYLVSNGEGISGIFKNQLDIFVYHSKTVVSSTHPYSSKWYTWPFILRPIWYYSAEFSNGYEAGISAFGNPLVWWTGIAATAFCAWAAIKKDDKNAQFLCIAYAADFLPWALVDRTMFIYHYFPSVPFVVLMIGYCISCLYKNNKKIKYVAYVYTVCVFLLFLLFYPILTGTPTNPEFVKTFLRWLPGWVLIK